MFPSPFPTNNPYISAAAEAGSGAAHLSAALAAAASQQAALKQRADAAAVARKHQDYSDLAEALKNGAIPVTDGPSDLDTNPATGRPTLAASDDSLASRLGTGAQVQNPDYSFDPRRIVSRGDRSVYYPTEEEKAAVAAKAKDNAETFVYSKAAADAVKDFPVPGLEDAKPGDRLPVRHVPAVTAAIRQKLQADAKQKDATDPATHYQVDQIFKDKAAKAGLHFEVGQWISKDMMAEARAQEEMSERQNKPPVTKSLHWETSRDENGNVNLHAFDPETGEEVKKYTYKGEGTARKGGAGGGTPKVSAAQLRLIGKTKSDRLEKAQQSYKKAVSEALTPEDHQQASADLKQEYQNAQLEYEQALSTALGKDVGHNSWADESGGTSAGSSNGPTAASPAAQRPGTKPATAPANQGGGRDASGVTGKRSVTLQQLRAYVAEQQRQGNAKFSEADAIREAAARGMSVIGQTDLRTQRASAAGGH